MLRQDESDQNQKVPAQSISDADIKKLWSSARGELLDFASHLERRDADITAGQMRMAISLADEAITRRARTTNLFRLVGSILHSGAQSTYRIDCTALDPRDVACLAIVALDLVPAFGTVEGVPRGGLQLAKALEPYATSGPLLIVDDVCTTGRALEVHRNGREAVGLVIFARGAVPTWAKAIFTMPWAIRSQLKEVP